MPEDVREQVQVDGLFHSPAAFVEAMGSYDLSIATRMHAAILALTAGTPVVPVAYEFKSRELFDRLGLGEFVCDVNSVTGPALAETVMGYIRGGHRTLAALQTGVKRERQSAAVGHGLLAEALIAALGATPS